MTEVQDRRKKTVEASMTEQVHLIMQQHLNGGGRLFGGALMQWLDEVAGVVAMRHAETYRVVTAAVDNLQFKHAIYEGEIVVLKGYVTYVGRTSMEVEIDTYVEQPDGMRHTVNRAFFVMVAVDEDQKPIQVPELIITTEAEKARNEAAKTSAVIRRTLGMKPEEPLIAVSSPKKTGYDRLIDEIENLVEAWREEHPDIYAQTRKG